jgi:LuxR family maltose regulon positive regulatory protein
MELLVRVTRRRIGLVVAPAGYGKSIAVSQYLLQAEVPCVWFVVRNEHTKPLGLAWGLARALSQDAPGLERGLLAAYERAAAENNTARALAAWFAAQLEDCSRTVVIDDLHLILEQQSLRDFIVSLIERAPPSVRWILVTRSALDLPLATWLAYGHADEPAGEEDLRIRSSEAAAIARVCDVAIGAEQLEELLGLTAGWPAAFIFALRAAARGAELGRIALETREKLYAYLADEAFDALSPSEQQFLIGTALLPMVDLELLAQAGWDEPDAIYTRLRRHAGFIVPESATTFHYHELFRDFLEHRLRLDGRRPYRHAQLASAALLEAADRADLALRLRVAVGDRAGIVRMLRDQASGPPLNGMVDPIEEALLSLPQELVRQDAILLGLFARTRALRSAYEESDTLYRAAIELAKAPDQRAKLALSYADSLQVRRDYDGAFAAVNDVDATGIHDLEVRMRLLSQLGVYRAMRGEFEEAQRLAAETLAVTVLGNLDLRAFVVYCAARVSHWSHRPLEERTRAAEALKAAEQSGNSKLVVRCCHALCMFALNDGDWESATDLLARMLAHAKREGDLADVNYALEAQLALAAMRGDSAMMAGAEAALDRDFDGLNFDTARLFARAMRSAWRGEFRSAAREAESGLKQLEDVDEVEGIFDLAHLAVYYAAAGDRDGAHNAVDRATTLTKLLNKLDRRGSAEAHRTLTLMNIAMVLLALAHALSLRSRAASDILSQLAQSDPKPVAAVQSLAQAARTLNRIVQGAADRNVLDRDIADVRERGLGGYADLLAALPLRIGDGSAAFGALTKTEMQMLRLIARGGTMKAIAVQLNRSPDTVETHIRAILRKLDCKSRSEAVALARDHGII